jgi:hypothetical protein
MRKRLSLAAAVVLVTAALASSRAVASTSCRAPCNPPLQTCNSHCAVGDEVCRSHCVDQWEICVCYTCGSCI